MPRLGFGFGAGRRRKRPPVSGAPVAVGELPHIYLLPGSGPVTIPTAAGFSGSDLVYSILAAPIGAVLAIDPTTGIITAQTDEALPEDASFRAITVLATNAFGSDVQTFPFFIVAESASDNLLRLANGNVRIASLAAVRPLRFTRQGDGTILVQESI